MTRQGSDFYLGGKRWTASGANVYWLGLDENVIPHKGEPFYAPFNASYPTKGRIVEVMNTLVTMGAHTIRSQTLGVSVGNPLSLEPELNVFNDQAFDTIDYAVYQAREHGLRIFAPLVDNYVSRIYRKEPSVVLNGSVLDLTSNAGTFGDLGHLLMRAYSSSGLLPRRQIQLPSVPRDRYQRHCGAAFGL